MATRKSIRGFLHFRTDLGDGVRTGVVFSDCSEACDGVCERFRFLPEHDFSDDTLERSEYTADELIAYLREERTLYYARKLGITFLGGEPLRDPFFCEDVARGLKELEIGLQIYTCGMCSMTAFERLNGLVDLYVIRVFLPILSAECGDHFDRGKQVQKVLDFLENVGTPYRVLLCGFSDSPEKAATEFADYACNLRCLKSVMLDFSSEELTPSEQRAVKSVFLERKIPIY